MHDLKGRVAFVAGAGSVGPGWGNGRATAVLLARQGATVFGTDLNDAPLQETRALIEKEGGSCAMRVANMTSAADVQAAVDDCLARFGRIDILVNNVGGSAPGGPVEMTEETFDAQIDHNLKTVFLGCKYVLPVMERQSKGAIVNLGSVAGIREHPGRTHVGYAATKGGIIQFTRAIAIKYAKQGIRANTVLPGLMHTPLVEHRLAAQISGNDAAALIAKRHAAVPMGRMGDAWDVANAVLFLVSDEARYITATELLVDGGISAVTL